MVIRTTIKETSPVVSPDKVAADVITRVYHIAYEPSFKTVTLHFWTKCNLKCRGCFCRYEKLYWNLYDDPQSQLEDKKPVDIPDRFLTVGEVIERLRDREVKTVLLMGVEPTIDPSLPLVARAMHQEFNSYNILMTNGMEMADLEDIDLVLFSLKAFTEEKHITYTGRSNRQIMDNFIKVYQSGKKLQAITLVIPQLIDTDEVGRIARFIASVDDSINFMIHAYFAVPNCPYRSATTEEVEEAVKEARKYLKDVPFRNLSFERVGEPAVQII